MRPENGINIFDSQLGNIAYNINIAKPASTKFTPYFLIFNKQARAPLKVLFISLCFFAHDVYLFVFKEDPVKMSIIKY